MAVPTVGTVVASGGTVAAGTTLILTLVAAANIGDVVFLPVVQATAPSTSSAVDSKGNTYVLVRSQIVGNTAQFFLLACLVTKALAIADTITISFGGTVQGAAAIALQLTGVPQNQIATTGGLTTGTDKNASSTSASSNSTTATRIDDSISFLIIGTQAVLPLLTDFTSGSVNQSYTNAGSAISSGGAQNSGICLCYKTITANNPMPAQSPTFTLNASRNWDTVLFMLSGLNARGAIGTWMRTGDAASGIANYVPHANDVLGKVPYGQIAKSPFDGAPQPVITPQEPKIGQQVSDGLLSSD